ADVNGAAVDSVVQEITAAGGKAVGVISNVSKEEDVQRMIDQAVDSFGSLDILVNNAGIMDNMVAAGNLTDELWNRVLDINLTGPMRAIRKALPIMIKQGKGVIVNTASIGGLFGSRAGLAYTASKHGVV
ncbi:SDR family NAD(P)-dependent oxidoreductase, partial [Paenibacillus sepulcri]|nr:SDR family NAD(P)-dependent oxidoreductase [Paenibacillus sepulcri]